MILSKFIDAVGFLLVLVPTAHSQAPVSGREFQTQSTFDVVSIRPSAKDGYTHWRTGPQGYVATNVTAQQLIFNAYSQADEQDGFTNMISLDQIRGLPKWAGSEQFDVTAKLDQQTMSRLSGLSEPERDKIYQKMLRGALAERFHLELHHERREQPVYLLVTSQDGCKLVPSSVQFDKSSLSEGRGQVRATGYGMGELVAELTGATGRIVVDQTHLTGVYDFQLKWRPDDETDPANTSPSIYTAVKEQLGLTLVPSKGPVDTIVITHLDQPTAN